MDMMDLLKVSYDLANGRLDFESASQTILGFSGDELLLKDIFNTKETELKTQLIVSQTEGNCDEDDIADLEYELANLSRFLSGMNAEIERF